ncbi:S24 family peptidase [Kaarinaea lacus]
MSHIGCSAGGLEPFVLKVIGDSMEPEFQDGNIIVVDPGFPLLNEVFAVLKNGEEILFGQYVQDETGTWLRYLNPAFDAVRLAPDFEVKGVVTQRNGRRRKDMKRYEYVTE